LFGGKILLHEPFFRELKAYLMDSNTLDENEAQISLRPVSDDNWRDVANLKVSEDQLKFVAEPCYYLALCCYGNDWRPLAIYLGEQVIGFMMWTTDPADNSCWLGGILVDQGLQNRGYGKQAVQAAMTMLNEEHGHRYFALSYQPANLIAKHLYSKLGFIEMDEWEGDEIVARLSLE
jgi:diamine N-acetyltransferase